MTEYQPTRIEEPVEVWRCVLSDGKRARATIVPQPDSVEIVWFIDDRLGGGESTPDWATAVRRSAEIRQMLSLMAAKLH